MPELAIIYHTDNKKMERKTPEKLISAVGTAALAAVFGIWCCGSSCSAWGFTAAAVSALMMLALCLRFVPVWCGFWRERSDVSPREPDGGRICAKIFAAVLLWDVFILLLGYVLRASLGASESLTQYLEFWRCTDSQHYLAIAEDWYLSEGEWDRLVQLVFLPGYPVLVRAFAIITGNYLYAGLIVSALSYAGAACLLYKLLRLDMGYETALRGVILFVLCPAAFFFVCPMSESLFLLCCLACLYLVRRGKTTAGCLIGAYAAFTRSLGILLLVPVLFELIGRRGKIREYAAALIIPMGFAAYCIINYLVAGDPFRFMEYQRVHWGQRLGWVFSTAAYQTEHAISSAASRPTDFRGLWLPNILAQLISLVIMTAAAKRLRPSYTAWFIAYFAVAIGATWLLSAPRYLAALPALPAAMALLTEKKSAMRAFAALSLLCGLAYFAAFLLRWQVW